MVDCNNSLGFYFAHLQYGVHYAIDEFAHFQMIRKFFCRSSTICIIIKITSFIYVSDCLDNRVLLLP